MFTGEDLSRFFEVQSIQDIKTSLDVVLSDLEDINNNFKRNTVMMEDDNDQWYEYI